MEEEKAKVCCFCKRVSPNALRMEVKDGDEVVDVFFIRKNCIELLKMEMGDKKPSTRSVCLGKGDVETTFEPAGKKSSRPPGKTMEGHKIPAAMDALSLGW